MIPQLNWKKIKTDLNRYANVDQLKTDVQRIGGEIRNFDYQKVLTPSAQQRVKAFEKRYNTMMRTLHQAQRQIDREFNRLLRQVNIQRKDVNKLVAEQRDKLEKLSADFRSRFVAAKKSKKKKTTKTTAKKATSRKRKKS